MNKHTLVNVLRALIPIGVMSVGAGVACAAECNNPVDCQKQGDMAYKQGNYELATAFYQKYLLYQEVKQNPDSVWCADAADCSRQGEAAYKRRDFTLAVALYRKQVMHVEEDNISCDAASANASEKTCDSDKATAYNNLAMANLHNGEPVKAQLWLSVAPSSASTEFNKRLVAKALAAHHWTSSPEGQYWSNAGFGLWSEVRVIKTGDKYDIYFDGFWVPLNGLASGPHSGGLEDVVAIRDGVAVLHSQELPECSVTARFKIDQVELSENDGCQGAFGVNVHANGTFVRVSSSID